MSRINPVEKESDDRTSKIVETIKVGKRGTRPVLINSETIGTPRARAAIKKIMLTKEKNISGLYSLTILKMVRRTLKPSLKVFNFEGLSAGRSLYSIGKDSMFIFLSRA